jgi:hypothetical protein
LEDAYFSPAKGHEKPADLIGLIDFLRCTSITRMMWDGAPNQFECRIRILTISDHH